MTTEGGMDWFGEWVRQHCTATGADAATARALLANRDLMTGDVWRATRVELADCTARLVAGMRVPKFANEHSDAVGRELVALREERARADRVAPAGDFAPDCPACGGSGVATVPHRRCVWQRRIVLHPEVRMLVTAGVLCDRPGCEAGRAARDKESARKDDKPRRPTLSQAERFHGCDLVELLRAHEREQARLSRRDDAGGGEWAALVASIKARASAAGGHPREDAA